MEGHKLGYKDAVIFVHIHIHIGRMLPSTDSLCTYFLTRGHLGRSQYFAITNNDARSSLCVSIFKVMEVYLQGGLLGQKGSAHVALPKPPGETPCAFRLAKSECVSHRLANWICCHTLQCLLA